MDDDDLEWRAALLLRDGSPPVDHKVLLIDGRPPGEFDRRRGDGRYDRYRLVRNEEACAVYDFVGTVEG